MNLRTFWMSFTPGMVFPRMRRGTSTSFIRYPHCPLPVSYTHLDVYKRQIYNCSNVVDNYLFGQGMDKLGYMEHSIATYWGVLGQYQLCLLYTSVWGTRWRRDRYWSAAGYPLSVTTRRRSMPTWFTRMRILWPQRCSACKKTFTGDSCS